ncbi:UNVERIFIED_CONTAM: hypothetical protein FKN15_056085 [Acipenser sinensis]
MHQEDFTSSMSTIVCSNRICDKLLLVAAVWLSQVSGENLRRRSPARCLLLQIVTTSFYETVPGVQGSYSGAQGVSLQGAERVGAAHQGGHRGCGYSFILKRIVRSQKFAKMAMQAAKRANIRLPPEVNRILYIRNLPYKITAEEMYDIFGKYGPIRQIRVGNTPESRGTAYVVYEDIFDAKNACDHLSGFNVCNRYLVVLYYNANRAFQKMDTKKKEEQLKLLKEKYGINTDPPK